MLWLLRSILTAALLATGILATPPAFAWPPTYGAEFEFTSEAMRTRAPGHNPNSKLKGTEAAAARRFTEEVQRRCLVAGCTLTQVPGKFDVPFTRVTFADGFWFQIGYDPAVVEITTKPATLEEWRALSPRIDSLIFDSAKAIDLQPDPIRGAGHFNFGVRSAFGDSVDSMLRFFVDFSNRPELANGIFRRNFLNGAPLAALGDQARDGLESVIRKHRRGQISSLRNLAVLIQDDVYVRAFYEQMESSHYQALGLKRVAQMSAYGADAPAEIRSMRAQTNSDEFIRFAEIIEARIRYLDSTLTVQDALLYSGTDRIDHSHRELASRFFIYLAEAGLSWNRYEDLLHSSLRTAGLDAFVNGNFDWQATDSVRAMLSHIELLATSPWVRARFERFFTESSVPTTGTAPVAPPVASADGFSAEHASFVLNEIERYAHEAELTAAARNRLLAFANSTKQRLPALARPGSHEDTRGRLCRGLFGN